MKTFFYSLLVLFAWASEAETVSSSWGTNECEVKRSDSSAVDFSKHFALLDSGKYFVFNSGMNWEEPVFSLANEKTEIPYIIHTQDEEDQIYYALPIENNGNIFVYAKRSWKENGEIIIRLSQDLADCSFKVLTETLIGYPVSMGFEGDEIELMTKSVTYKISMTNGAVVERKTHANSNRLPYFKDRRRLNSDYSVSLWTGDYWDNQVSQIVIENEIDGSIREIQFSQKLVAAIAPWKNGVLAVIYENGINSVQYINVFTGSTLNLGVSATSPRKMRVIDGQLHILSRFPEVQVIDLKDIPVD